MTKTRNTPTDWFPFSVNPVHIGVYRLRHPRYPEDKFIYSHWNGKFWGLVMMLPEAAEYHRDTPTACIGNKPYDAWCGVVEKPDWA